MTAKSRQRVLFCQRCGRFQVVQGEVQPCESCRSCLFNVRHPRDLRRHWVPMWTEYDAQFVHTIEAGAQLES